MTKRYAVLQKKLEELESELNEIFSLPAETPCLHLLSDGIEQKFVFLKNLLSAESAVSHPSTPHHLEHIARRVQELETAFRDCDVRASALDHVDAASMCSCTESCLNDDDDEDLASLVLEDPEVFLDAAGEPARVEAARGGARRRERTVLCWREFGAMVSGMLFGAALMGVAMVRFSDCFHDYREYECFPTPT